MKIKCGITAVCLALSLLTTPKKPTVKPQKVNFIPTIIAVEIEKMVSIEEKITQSEKERLEKELKANSAFGIILQYNESYNVTENKLTKSKGVNYFNGHRETWYSQQVLPGGGLKIPGRHVANDGTIRDGEGYIVISANKQDLSYNETILTSLGPAKVYDTGVQQGTLDLYVNWN